LGETSCFRGSKPFWPRCFERIKERNNMKTRLLIGLLAGFTLTLQSGPVRPIVSSQFNTSAPVPNGPPIDPPARKGQWFFNVTNNAETASTWEFHDSDDALSIRGVVVAIAWGSNSPVVGYTNISGFTVLATVSNNPASGPMMPGLAATNAHFEQQLTPQPYYHETMWRTKIASEFAAAQAGPGGPPRVGPAPAVFGMTPPYFQDPFAGNQYLIEAQNETHAAWYCYSVSDPANPGNPPGAYYVPAWDLGDIPPGQTAQVLMIFQIKTYGGAPTEMPLSDLRHSVIRASYNQGMDVFYNRSESLKMSEWLDYLLVDGGTLIYVPPDPPNSYEPIPYAARSDVSVFFNSAPPGQIPSLQITPLYHQGLLNAIKLDWPAFDVNPVVLQYCDDLAAGKWTAVPASLLPPPLIPGPMSWTDNGSVILPPLNSPRFYRLLFP
jgi:hypothetical protein